MLVVKLRKERVLKILKNHAIVLGDDLPQNEEPIQAKENLGSSIELSLHTGHFPGLVKRVRFKKTNPQRLQMAG
jgi:hypothetical protein